MKISIDALVLSTVPSLAASTNRGNTAGVISTNIALGAAGGTNGSLAVQVTSANAVDVILRLGQVLDEANIPETGRFVVIPAWFANRLKNSNLNQAYLTGDGESIVRNGKLGVIDRFTVYVSNQVASATEGTATLFSVIAGTKDAISFASQMTDVETLRSPDTFGDIVRGLNVFGFNVLAPAALATLVCRQ